MQKLKDVRGNLQKSKKKVALLSVALSLECLGKRVFYLASSQVCLLHN